MSTKDFLGLATRCRNDPIIVEFCDYYLNEGVDKIYIVDDASTDKSIYTPLLNNNKIHITWKEKHESQTALNHVYFGLYEKIKNDFEWMIICDVDEFITAKRNLHNTIRVELSTTFKDVDCVKIPWVMMAFNNIKHTPKTILKTNTWRRNQDAKHVVNNKIFKFRPRNGYAMEVKCIFKTNSFNKIERHHPLECVGTPLVVDHQNREDSLSSTVRNFKENDIKTGFLLCYHYRIYSLEHATNKQTTSSLSGYNTSLENIISNDFAEIEDFTMVNKLP